jgi:hypothetical protein
MSSHSSGHAVRTCSFHPTRRAASCIRASASIMPRSGAPAPSMRTTIARFASLVVTSI